MTSDERSPLADPNNGSRTAPLPFRRQYPWKWMTFGFNLFGAAVFLFAFLTNNNRRTSPVSGSLDSNIDMLRLPLESGGGIPLPSEQDWCMAPGRYEFFGTYRRSPNHVAEGGFFFAPGRFQGTIFTDQNDDTFFFHLVNVTYGNPTSPHHHIPQEGQHNYEPDLFNAFCTLSEQGGPDSACYAPKHFPKGHTPTRCAKLSIPSTPGGALCRRLSMATFEFQGTEFMGSGRTAVPVEQWRARLSTQDPDTPNEYDGELRLYMQSVSENLKLPLTHWLMSDDQTLEVSFQIMNQKPWDTSKFPAVPEGCENAIEVSEEPPDVWNLNGRDGRVSCPFGVMHRHLLLKTLRNHM